MNAPHRNELRGSLGIVALGKEHQHVCFLVHQPRFSTGERFDPVTKILRLCCWPRMGWRREGGEGTDMLWCGFAAACGVHQAQAAGPLQVGTLGFRSHHSPHRTSCLVFSAGGPLSSLSGVYRLRQAWRRRGTQSRPALPPQRSACCLVVGSLRQ